MKRSAYDFLGAVIWAVRRLTTDRHMNASDSCVLPRATYSPWQVNGEFDLLYRAIDRFTMVDKYRLWELWKLAQQARRLPGCYVEVGTWKGGSAAVIAAAADPCELWLFDTFSGVPESDCGGRDLYRGGEHAAESLEAFCALPPMPSTLVHVVPGVFPQSAPDLSVKFMHIDVDTHDGTQNALAWASSRMVVGGVIVVDDYGFATTRGARKAVDEFDDSRYVKIHNLNGHAALVRVGA